MRTGTLGKLRKRRYDLPLYRGNGGQLVTWIVGVMTYLTVLSMVLIFAMNNLQHYWQSGLTGHLTVEIPYETAPQEKIDALIAKLNDLSGITARQLTNEDMTRLVGPWLGEGAQIAELPLPVLIDINRDGDRDAPSVTALEGSVKQAIPNATLDTHQEWLADLLKLAKACRMILIGIALILALTTALTVAATARTRLALHRDEVDLLHLIGATDSYIATQFQRQAFRLATEGAAIGLGIALATLFIVGMVKQHLGSTLLPGLNLSAPEWLFLLLSPLMAGLIAMLSSRFTVLRALKSLP